jgi:hypothetical protein
MRGRIGASARWPTKPWGRGGSAQWFPSGQYGPGVLEEHTGGAGEGGGKSHRRDGVQAKAEAPSEPVTRSGTGGDRNRRTGGREIAHTLKMSDPATARLPGPFSPTRPHGAGTETLVQNHPRSKT